MRSVTLLIMAALTVAANTEPKRALEGKTTPDHSRVQRIFETYTLINDFAQKVETRPISKEIFWRYPFVPPKANFPIDFALGNPADIGTTIIPLTRGAGRAIDHLNRGRMLFLEGRYVEAKNTWLGGRARYGKDYPYHRRADYFIGNAFLQLAAEAHLKGGKPLSDGEVRNHLSNAATFLSWAFILKGDLEDPFLDQRTPQSLYNLAAIYWNYERFAGAYGAAEMALSFLRKMGRKDLRPRFNRLMAESFILNRTYLEAAQTIDQGIRLDPIPEEAAPFFDRAGDIYFDLSNYELASEMYEQGSALYEHLKDLDPAHLILRAESLFWLKKFSDAQKLLNFALEGSNYRKVVRSVPPEYIPWARLRMADAYLARGQIEDAKLEYYKVGHEFRNHLAARLARIREACLELPFYGGKNVGHARTLLETAKEDPEIPPVAQEIAWACQVGSYTTRERTPDMLARVKAFAESHPESEFLGSFVEPVRDYQATHIDQLFAKKDLLGALSFFEKNRMRLFPKVSAQLAAQLFDAYADLGHPKKAAEFWTDSEDQGDLDLLRNATVAFEMQDSKPKDPLWTKRANFYRKKLLSRPVPESLSKSDPSYLTRIRLTTSARTLTPFLLEFASRLGRRGSKDLCDLQYPLLIDLRSLGGANANKANEAAQTLIQQKFPALLQTNPTCAMSLLEFEFKSHETSMTQLGRRYLTRTTWPLTKDVRGLLWTISEQIYQNGNEALARDLWQYLVTKSPSDSEEARYAKARLDPTRTEYEKLWP